MTRVRLVRDSAPINPTVGFYAFIGEACPALTNPKAATRYSLPRVHAFDARSVRQVSPMKVVTT